MSVIKRTAVIMLLLVPSGLYAQWTQVSSGTNQVLEKVIFTDSLTAYISGEFGRVMRSSDGGQSWTSRNYQFPMRLYDMFFYDSLHGYIAGDNGTIAETHNGGLSWIKRNLSTIETYRGIYVGENGRGVAVGDKGVIFSSQDSGHTWRKDSVPLKKGLKDVIILPGGKCIAVGDTGTMLVKNSSDTVWQQVSSGTITTLRSVFFTDAAHGYAAGGQFDLQNGFFNVFIRTSDSGKTWSDQVIPVNKQVNNIWFVNRDTGYAACSGGFLMKSVDGGYNWFRQYTGTINYLNAVSFSTEQKGILVGDGGLVYRTGNGGGWAVSAGNMKMTTGFTFYPNPARDRVKITLGNDAEPDGYAEIFDVCGRKLGVYVFETGDLHLNPPPAAGIYLLKVYSRLLPLPAVGTLRID